MKKFFSFCLVIIMTFALRLSVDALGASISVSSSTIEKGNSVKATVTVSGAAAWNVKIFSSGATNGCDASYADATSDGKNTTKSFTVTCKSMSTGLINFSISGDITDENGSNKTISGSKSVKVTEPRAKSTNNNLSSLNVEGYEIIPEFSKDVLEYSVDVPNTIDKIIIKAKADDSYASVSGTGEVEVIEGTNKFSIVVTSETGSEKTYTLNVNVEDKDPIKVNVSDIEYSVVKNKKALVIPELFTETTVDINGFAIPAFYSDVTKLTLVGLKDNEGNLKLFEYKDGDYIEYKELKIANTILRLMDKENSKEHFTKSTILINNIEYDCLKLSNDSDYALFYGMNMANAKEGFYLYDSVEETLQRYDDELIESLNAKIEKNEKNTKTLYMVLIVLIIFVIFVIIMFSVKNHKIKKALNIKDDKISKDKKENKK